jgi:hypothetical protein
VRDVAPRALEFDEQWSFAVVSWDHHNSPIRTIYEGVQARFCIPLDGLRVL